MTKTISIFLITLTFVFQACSNLTPMPSETLQAPPDPASNLPTTTTLVVSPTPEEGPVSVNTPELEADLITDEMAPVSGLRVYYLRGGNLWSWTDENGKVQLTDTEDMTTIHVSEDNQTLAFMRGSSVWKVRADGTGVQLLDTQTEIGGVLSFAPNGNLLAVSTRDHIDIIDLTSITKTTMLTYSAIPDGYFPEVVWNPDSTGFKTVIPASNENENAEMLFVFTNGTVASLAKFEMFGFPYLSPDGGYAIYVSEMGEDRKSLYLMDSSGATRPYGKAEDTVSGYGWFTDAKRFLYESGFKMFIGNVGSEPVEVNLTVKGKIIWVNDMTYIALQDDILGLGDLQGANTILDSGVSDFDAALVN